MLNVFSLIINVLCCIVIKRNLIILLFLRNCDNITHSKLRESDAKKMRIFRSKFVLKIWEIFEMCVSVINCMI